ncbi:hypothetical protein IWW38_006523, partial [Coemansia aciculifera]
SAAPQASAAVASAGDSLIANEAAAVRKDLAVSAASVFASEVDTDVVGQDNKSLAAHSDVAALTETLEHVDLAASDSQVPSPTAASVKGDAAKAASAKESTVGTKGGKSRSQSKASETSSAKPASAWGATKSASKDASELAATANATVASASTRATGSNTVVASESSLHQAASKAATATAPTPAPWSNGAAAKGKQPKKSLLQIQQEEEEALRKRQQADEQQRALTSATRGFGPSYADRLGGASLVAPRSLAAIMAEQSKESSRNSSAVSVASAQVADDSATSASGWTVARVIASQTSPAPAPPATPSSGPAWGGASPSSGSAPS